MSRKSITRGVWGGFERKGQNYPEPAGGRAVRLLVCPQAQLGRRMDRGPQSKLGPIGPRPRAVGRHLFRTSPAMAATPRADGPAVAERTFPGHYDRLYRPV